VPKIQNEGTQTMTINKEENQTVSDKIDKGIQFSTMTKEESMLAKT
jgi:hypothetical protein